MPIEAIVLAALAFACSRSPGAGPAVEADGSAAPDMGSLASPTPPAARPSSASAPAPTPACGGGRNLTVHFYDVAEALSALVDLPDGRHFLVDTGDGSHRRGCGGVCQTAGRHLMDRLRADLHGAPIDLVWITHQHADHIGGAPELLEAFRVLAYVDNGRDAGKDEVQRAHAAAERAGASIAVVDPDHLELPVRASANLLLTPIVPAAWPRACSRDPNECSIGLRVDFCQSSVLFTGDAEHDEEGELDPHGAVTLLQVAHHGSETSTTPRFLAKTHPKYAVISAGRPDEGYNRSFCHPRAIVVRRLTRVLGGSTARDLESFDGDRCDRAQTADWTAVPTSDSLWATERDGDVVLATAGDGVFHRVRP